MTAQLPPNLLKLFASRPPLPYSRPVGKSPNTIRPKNVDGVFDILQQIREESAISIAERGKSSRKAKKDASAKKGAVEGDTAMANGDTKEDGEEEDQAGAGEDLPEDPTKEPGFTYAEETRRQIAREEKAKRRKEAFEKAKASCKYILRPGARLCCYLAVAHDYLPYPRQPQREQQSSRRPIQDTLHFQACMRIDYSLLSSLWLY